MSELNKDILPLLKDFYNAHIEYTKAKNVIIAKRSEFIERGEIPPSIGEYTEELKLAKANRIKLDDVLTRVESYLSLE